MNWLINKARADMRHQVATVVQEPLEVIRTRIGDVEARLEAVTGAQHADLQAKILATPDAIEGAVRSAFQAESVELARMLRQQGDASDEVAETLGRTLARLGAEVEALARAVERLESRLGLPATAE
jgi:phage shock protein A